MLCCISQTTSLSEIHLGLLPQNTNNMESYFVPIPINFINTKTPQIPSKLSGSQTMPTRRKCYPKASISEPAVTKGVLSQHEKVSISELPNSKEEEEDDVPPPLPPKSPHLLRRALSRSDLPSSTRNTDKSGTLEKAFMPIDHPAKVIGKPPLHRSNSMPCRRVRKKKQEEGPSRSDDSSSSFSKPQEIQVQHRDTGLVEFKTNGKQENLSFGNYLVSFIFRGTANWCDCIRLPQGRSKST